MSRTTLSLCALALAALAAAGCSHQAASPPQGAVAAPFAGPTKANPVPPVIQQEFQNAPRRAPQ